MYCSNALVKINDVDAKPEGWSRTLSEDSTVRLVTAEDEREALRFLQSRPVHTINLRAFIRDNGLTSALNRGDFYGYRNPKGELEGVALIGHATLVEASTDRALEALARKAQGYGRAHMIMGEQDRIEEFWSYYSEDGQRKRTACRELLFELRWPVEALREVSGLRPATLDDLELILPVQAAMAEQESGVNPMTKEPEGFRRRCARRIEKGKTWVLIEDGKLIFKTEIFADTPEATYLEGIYVDEEERGKGYGLRCLSQLTRTLLQRTERLCILVNEKNSSAHAFYRKLGFKFTSIYDTIFLEQN
ncbi:MAG TPA: GNAT family N-acetyltransferase [Pyrinomonadaceae bacterium]|nr:GNAT family N-acetyltransferase [Pyrinomonadaceae bacterium]